MRRRACAFASRGLIWIFAGGLPKTMAARARQDVAGIVRGMWRRVVSFKLWCAASAVVDVMCDCIGLDGAWSRCAALRTPTRARASSTAASARTPRGSQDFPVRMRGDEARGRRQAVTAGVAVFSLALATRAFSPHPPACECECAIASPSQSQASSWMVYTVLYRDGWLSCCGPVPGAAQQHVGRSNADRRGHASCSTRSEYRRPAHTPGISRRQCRAASLALILARPFTLARSGAQLSRLLNRVVIPLNDPLSQNLKFTRANRRVGDRL